MTIANTIRATIARAIGYQTQGEGHAKIHYSLTRLNALRWAHCYTAATVTRRGKFIASTKLLKVSK